VRTKKLLSLLNLYWLIIVLVSLIKSYPLCLAWKNDPQLRLGGVIFAFWIFAIIPYWRIDMNWSKDRLFFFVIASVSLFLGILGELQILIYLALAMLLVIPVFLVVWRVIFSFFAVLWTPLWSWFCLSVFDKSISCISLAIAVLLVISSFLYAYFFHEAKTGKTFV